MRYDHTYLTIADDISDLSYDEHIQVGSILVKNGQIISMGWNGTPTGMDNSTRDRDGVTYPTVIHSEANALMKLAKNGGGSDGATLYTTHSPCMKCALLLLQAGITRIVYRELYCNESVTFLEERGINIECIKPSNQLLTYQDFPRQSEQSEGK